MDDRSFQSSAWPKIFSAVDKVGGELSTAVGNGTVFTGKKYNVARIPAVKGQGFPAWEPRTLKATRITYVTSAMGADHTAGLIAMPVADMARASQDSQIVNAICDSSGFCQFMTPTSDEMKRLFNMMYGLNLSDEDIINYGWQCLQDEWESNRRAGFTEADDKFPDWMSTEAIPTIGAVFDVQTDEIRRVFTKMPVTPELMQMHPTG